MTALSPTDDGEPLGRMMRDLVALSVLPTVWQRSEPLEVAQSLAIVLEKTLGLALVGVLLEAPADVFDGLGLRDRDGSADGAACWGAALTCGGVGCGPVTAGSGEPGRAAATDGRKPGPSAA